MNNDLTSLNNYLFEELERLNDDEELEKNLDKELKRSKAISSIAKNIIDNANVVLEAAKLQNEYGIEKKELPKLLQIESKENSDS